MSRPTPSRLEPCELQQLRPDHCAAVVAFELENRDYFARSLTDRGDEFYTHLEAHHRRLVAAQDAGGCAFHVLVDGHDETIVGRFNLYDLNDGTARVGYRVAERVTGRGVATAALLELCRIAVERHGLRTLTAEASESNLASRRVLAHAGFAPVGECVVGGAAGTRFAVALTWGVG